MRWGGHGMVVVAWWVAGCDSPEQEVCEEVCDQLVTECGFAAYPDRGSCMEGCLHSAGEGAPVLGLATCLAEASCDPFEVVACARLYGEEG